MPCGKPRARCAVRPLLRGGWRDCACVCGGRSSATPLRKKRLPGVTSKRDSSTASAGFRRNRRAGWKKNPADSAQNDESAVRAESEDTGKIFTPGCGFAQVVVGVKKNRPRCTGERAAILAHARSTLGQARAANSGSELPHSTWCEANGLRGRSPRIRGKSLHRGANSRKWLLV
jgi:hypothetical protein